MRDAEFDTWSDLTIVHLVNGLLSAHWSVLLVLVGGVIVADESELTDIVALDDQRLDVSKRFEQLSDVFLGLVSWDVLDIDVVDQSSE